MSRREKLLKRFLLKPNDFTYNELVTLLNGFGYRELTGGKTSGSRIAFIDESTLHVIRLHKPHPGNILKYYQIEQIIDEFKRIGTIK
jgi:hypothetical protein